MEEILDEKDTKILEILQENAKLSSYKIAKKSGIPTTTINNRIKKLQKLGIIKRFTVDIDHRKLGYTIHAYIFITLSMREFKELKLSMDDFLLMLKKEYRIEELEFVTGDFDLIIKIRAKTVEEVHSYVVNTLTNYKGISRTSTSIVLKTH